MKEIVNKKWITGSQNPIDFYEMLKILKQYSSVGGKIFIGTDSFVSSNKVCFASAVCLHGEHLKSRYFFFKDFESKKSFEKSLVSRITEETRRSIEIGCLLMDEYGFKPTSLELHLDVSPFSLGNATSKFSDMLKGYVQGYGFDYRMKPDAWASQSIADKHSK